jgi:hypothetical protein
MNAKVKDEEPGCGHTNCALHAHELSRIGRTVDEIHKRLFVDNGEPCLQSKVRRVSDVVNAVIWAVGVIIVAVVGVIVKGWGVLFK